jgi:hypothetical protein
MTGGLAGVEHPSGETIGRLASVETPSRETTCTFAGRHAPADRRTGKSTASRSSASIQPRFS